MVGIGDTDRIAPVEQGPRDDIEPGLLHAKKKFAVQIVEVRFRQAAIGRDVAEADDVHDAGRHQLELGIGMDQRFQVGGLFDILFDERREGIHAMGFERHPKFERLEVARQLDAAVREGKAAGHDTAVRAL